MDANVNFTENLDRVDILGVRVIAEPFDRVVCSVLATLQSDRRAAEYLCPTGVHGVIEAQADPDFQRILNTAAFTIADGMPLVRVAQFRGFRQAERAFGPDVMLAVLAGSAPLGVRHFFYGGRPGVADQLADIMIRRFPELRVVGTYCPPFRTLTRAEEDDIVKLINGVAADAVWIGLSTPKQERWVDAFRSRLNVKLLLTVGAAFDYNLGGLRPAPEWMRAASLEWLFRIVQEPRRLWRRYANIIPRFVWLMALDTVRRSGRTAREHSGPNPPSSSA